MHCFLVIKIIRNNGGLTVIGQFCSFIGMEGSFMVQNKWYTHPPNFLCSLSWYQRYKNCTSYNTDFLVNVSASLIEKVFQKHSKQLILFSLKMYISKLLKLKIWKLMYRFSLGSEQIAISFYFAGSSDLGLVIRIFLHFMSQNISGRASFCGRQVLGLYLKWWHL